MNQSMTKMMLISASIILGSAVAFGAIGSHALQAYLFRLMVEDSIQHQIDQQEIDHRLATWETAVRYQTYHGLAILGLAAVSFHHRNRLMQLAVWFFLVGIILFCGMLYVWVLSQQKWSVMIVPIGGVSFIGGWMCSLLSFLKFFPIADD